MTDDEPLSLYRVSLTVSGQPRSDGIAQIAVTVLEYVEAVSETEAREKALGRARTRFHHGVAAVKTVERGTFVRFL